mmetsp:Transcript_40059/g.58969  ORF Transcript_40059/g.58969 Transcript_40059/m.58969 type:complete len:317 (-) Transcript_40059:596-1546(-)
MLNGSPRGTTRQPISSSSASTRPAKTSLIPSSSARPQARAIAARAPEVSNLRGSTIILSSGAPLRSITLKLTLTVDTHSRVHVAAPSAVSLPQAAGRSCWSDSIWRERATEGVLIGGLLSREGCTMPPETVPVARPVARSKSVSSSLLSAQALSTSSDTPICLSFAFRSRSTAGEPPGDASTDPTTAAPGEGGRLDAAGGELISFLNSARSFSMSSIVAWKALRKATANLANVTSGCAMISSSSPRLPLTSASREGEQRPWRRLKTNATSARSSAGSKALWRTISSNRSTLSASWICWCMSVLRGVSAQSLSRISA